MVELTWIYETLGKYKYISGEIIHKTGKINLLEIHIKFKGIVLKNIL